MYERRMCTHIIYTYAYIVYYIELKVSAFVIAFGRLNTRMVVTIGHGDGGKGWKNQKNRNKTERYRFLDVRGLLVVCVWVNNIIYRKVAHSRADAKMIRESPQWEIIYFWIYARIVVFGWRRRRLCVYRVVFRWRPRKGKRI